MNSIINLNKPTGITSRQAVTKVKRLLGVKKAGHSGTLDPIASGVLLISLNEATKISRFLIHLDKEYVARMKLGESTDTYDCQGRIVEKKDISALSEADLVRTVISFMGRIKQKPPMYSAVKVGGRPLYKFARKGLVLERDDRVVEIHDIQIREVRFPYFSFSVTCSKGTYIRTLCHDIGEKLGTGAHMVSLERTRVGSFTIHDSLTFEDVLSEKHSFCSIDSALAGLKEIHLNNNDYQRAKHGNHIVYDKHYILNNNEFVKLKGPAGNLFCIGRVQSDLIRVERVLNM
jgi:tRNA pseudouridine55 synthase